jgi:DUF1009 family protein
MSSTAIAAVDTPLGIICGGGTIPLAVADAVSKRGRGVVLFPLVGWADAAAVARYKHHWIHIGHFGRFCRTAKSEGVRDIVFIGTLVRPAVRQIRLDWKTIQLFPRIIRAFRGGDNHLLTNIGSILEDYGFRLVGAHEVAPEILVAAGPLGRHRPRERDLADIAHALEVLAALGDYDVGQAVVVADRQVLAMESAEGTDRMLARVAELRRDGRIRLPTGIGVLVKAPKKAQDRRYDLPTVGPETIEAAARAGLAGVAIPAGAAIAVDPQRMATLADASDLFVVGLGDAP